MEEEFAYYDKSERCLICKDYFEEKPLPGFVLPAERDGLIVDSDNGNTDNGQLLVVRWKAALQLFSRLLHTSTEEAGAGYVWDTSRFHLVLEKLFEKTRTQGIFQSPCCSICSSVLFEIVKLQEAIDENMKLQEERVKQLKQKLAAISVAGQNQDDDDNLFGESNMDMEPEWDNISIPDACSDFSVAAVLKSKVKSPNRKRGRGRPPSKRQPEVAVPKTAETLKTEKLEMKSCVVLLERLSDNKGLPTNEIEIEIPASSTSRERRSKLKAQEIIRKSCGVSLKDEFVELPVKRTRKSHKKKRKVEESEEEDEWKVPVAGGPENEVSEPTVDEENDNSDDYEIASNSKRQRRKGQQSLNGKRKTILGTHLSRKLVGPRRVARSDLFLLINDNFLFHKSTVIEVYLRHKMICKEANCAFEAEGIDSSAFDKIREHIIKTHMTKKNYSHKIRSCPVCGKYLSGHTLKIHLIEHHQVAKVVCEICWKPLQTSMPRAHMFRHKSEEERKAAIEDGHDGPRPTSKTGKVRKIPASIRRLRITQASQIRRIQPNNKQSKEGLWFRTVNDEYLIYKLTLVRFTFNQSFQCGEFDCSFNVSGTTFDSFQIMRKHLATHLESREYFHKLRECPLCSNSYLGFDFKTHFAEQHHLRLDVICEICCRPLSVKKCMPWKHSWTHKNDEEKALEISLGDQGKPYEYGYKVKSMSMKNTLPVQARDLLAHLSGLRSFECEICKKKLTSRRILQSHFERVHRPDLITNPIICEICGKQFHPHARGNFAEHMRTDHPQTDDINVLLPFVCGDCGARFKRKPSLRNHRTAHHTHPEGTVKQHQCEFCEMTFLQKQCLTRHQFCMHSDFVPEGMEDDPRMLKVIRMRERAKDFIGPRRAYPCEVCGKVYLSMSCSTTHQKKAHGIQ